MRYQTATAMAAALLRASEKLAPTPIRILLLDDEPDMELLLRNRFRREVREGMYEILFATDGQAGLEVLRRRADIDLVLTDINMPGMDGLTFLAHVNKVNPTVRVVVVSAYNDMANLRLAMNRGAFDFLVKPIEFDDLQVTIEKCASQVAVLRQAVRSQQENGLLRLLVGRSELAGIPATALEKTEGSVAFLGVDQDGDSAGSLTALNDWLAVIVPELVARRAAVIRLVGPALMVVFRGEDHARRALDAWLAIREGIRALEERRPAPGPPSRGVSVGVDVGPLAIGHLGSRGPGAGFESIVLGEPVDRAFALQRLAGRNEILVSSALDRLLDLTFVRQPLDWLEVTRLAPPAFAITGKTSAVALAPGERLKAGEAPAFPPSA